MRRRSTTRFFAEGLEGAVVMGAALCSWPLSRRWLRNWGSDAEDRHRRWPGDALVSTPHQTSTRAIHISVPAERVWPWVVQLGMYRGGFYSYELLERLAGIRLTNIESIEPTMQTLEVGDEIYLHPKEAIRVAYIDEGRALCFGDEEERQRSWSLYVDPSGEGSRLVARSCIAEPRRGALKERVGLAIGQPIDFVMEQRMLRTIKRLAEGSRR